MKIFAFAAAAMLMGGAAQIGSNAEEQNIHNSAELPAEPRTAEEDIDRPHEEHAAAMTDIEAGLEYTGMGGPLEEETGYPPCRPGPGDDRCIQLYERGVTGAGN